ncbi:MAG: hypothetical protein H8D23_37260 [Candidatus Brocadiales bacterium]|nr:hypothetical protein [Candidatus Brocadiales bacterium]
MAIVPVKATKPGWKSSEFWVTLLMPVVGVVITKVLGFEITPEMMDGILGMFGITGGAYIVSRGVGKHGDETPTV